MHANTVWGYTVCTQCTSFKFPFFFFLTSVKFPLKGCNGFVLTACTVARDVENRCPFN